MKNRYLDENGNFQFVLPEVKDEKPKKAVVVSEEVAVVKETEVAGSNELKKEDLELMLVAELKALALDKGIRTNKNMNKAKLVELLLG